MTSEIDAPVQVSPSGAITTGTPVYTFSEVAGATAYQVYRWDATGAATGYVTGTVTCNAGTCSLAQAPALALGYYTWAVSALNAGGEGPWSPYLGFTVTGVPPVPPSAAPVQVSPSGAITTGTPVYTFSEVAGATAYQVYRWDATGAATGYVTGTVTCDAGTCTLAQAPALALGYYTWAVRALNAGGEGPWSPYLGFTVTGVPPVRRARPRGR